MSDESRFEIGNKAEQLYFSVFDLTTNRSHYPTKFRRMADELQKCALTIHDNLLSANSIKPDTLQRKTKRYDLQIEAVAQCNRVLSLAKYSMHKNLISSATGEQWTELAHDIKFMTLAWSKT